MLRAFGDVALASNAISINKQYGLSIITGRTPNSAALNFSITVTDGIAETADYTRVLPMQRVVLTNASQNQLNFYVKDVLDTKHFTLINSSGNSPADGEYTGVCSYESLVSIE